MNGGGGGGISKLIVCRVLHAAAAAVSARRVVFPLYDVWGVRTCDGKGQFRGRPHQRSCNLFSHCPGSLMASFRCLKRMKCTNGF
jgi:hypothetical protein